MRTKISRWTTNNRLIAMSLEWRPVISASYADVELLIVPARMKCLVTANPPVQNQYGFKWIRQQRYWMTLGVNGTDPCSTWSSEPDCDAV